MARCLLAIGHMAATRADFRLVLTHRKGAKAGGWDMYPMRPGDRLRVGRARDNDIVLDEDPPVSRVHAVLSCAAGGLEITDLDSCNGTYVNGSVLHGSRPLSGGDVVRIGHCGPEFVAELRRTEASEAFALGSMQ